MNWKTNIKNKFRNREIQPSNNLWENLEQQLQQNENKSLKSKWLYYLIGISAAAAVVFGVFYSFPSSDEIITNERVTVHIPSEKNNKKTTIVKDTFLSENPTKTKKIENKNRIANKKQIQPTSEPEIDYDKYVDELFKDDLTEIWKQLEVTIKSEYQIDSLYIAMGLDNLSPQELLQMATTEARLEAYLERKYDTEKIFAEVEKETFKERMQNILNKIVNEYDRLRLALNEKKE